MKKHSGKNRISAFGSNRRMGKAVYALGTSGHFVKREPRTGKYVNVRTVASLGASENQESRVFVGPSVEGADVEYVLIASGRLSEQKPSFAR